MTLKRYEIYFADLNPIAVDQIRTISKQRLKRKIDSLTPREAKQLRKRITEMYGDAV